MPLDGGDNPPTRDAARSVIGVRRFGGGSEEQPGRVACQGWSFGETELPWVTFPGDAPLLSLEHGVALEPGLIRRALAIVDWGITDDGLFAVESTLPGTDSSRWDK